MPEQSADIATSPWSKPKHTILQERGRVEGSVDRSEANVFSFGRGVGIRPEVLDLMDPLGDQARRGLPESSIIALLRGSVRKI